MTAEDAPSPIDPTDPTDPRREDQEAHEHLLRADPRLARIVAEQGTVDFRVWHDSPFALHEGDLFEGLALHIVSQQISTASAVAIFGRLAAFCGGRIAAEPLAQASLDQLRAVGLSGSKSRTLSELGARVTSGALDLAALGNLTDAEVQERLVALWGIGPLVGPDVPVAEPAAARCVPRRRRRAAGGDRSPRRAGGDSGHTNGGRPSA